MCWYILSIFAKRLDLNWQKTPLNRANQNRAFFEKLIIWVELRKGGHVAGTVALAVGTGDR